MKKFRLKIGVDVDGVLKECFEYACRVANEELGLKLNPENSRGYNLVGTEYEPVIKYFSNPEFVRTQPLYSGAKEFIEKLQERGEVFFITSVPAEVMSARACVLMSEFPSVPKENIIMGTRKELVKVDVLLDDSPDNITESESAYPVLMRKPWNSWMTGCLSVNNYNEFLTLIDTILKGYTRNKEIKGNKLYCIVGPSGSGKTVIAKELLRQNKAIKVKSYTTRTIRDDDTLDAYHFVSKEKFLSLKEEGTFCETTTYANNHYGSSRKDIANALKENNVVMVLDICGAIAMKKEFPRNVLIVFIKREKRDIISAILKKNTDNEDKVNRIISLSDELKNEDLADIVIENNKNASELVTELFS